MEVVKVETINVLQSEHKKIARILDITEHAFAAFRDGTSPNYDLINLLIEYVRNFPDRVHHRKEDFVYRKLKFRVPEAIAELVDLELEHKRLDELTSRFAEAIERVELDQEIPRDYVCNVVRDFIDFSREHMRKEEQGFLPLAQRSLLPEDWSDIACSIARMSLSPNEARSEAKCSALFLQIIAQSDSTFD